MNDVFIEQEIRQYHKIWFAEYLARVISIYYKHNQNNNNISYNQVYDSCFDTFCYSDEEKNELYQNVDDFLTNKYNLFFAHNNRDDRLYLIDISEGEDKKC